MSSIEVSEAPARRLAEGYYVRNFETVLETVARRYGDLLAESERAFLAAFEGLDEAAKRLYVRLVSRRGPCFRRDRLSYPEIADLDSACRTLADAGLLDGGEDEAPAVLLELLLRDELLTLCRALGHGDACGRIGELRAALVEAVEEEALRAAVRARLEVARPLGVETVLRLRLLFFGNLHQDWSAFVLRDLGVARYEDYPLDRALRRFPDREAVEHVFALGVLRQHLRIVLESGEDEDENEDRALDAALALAAPVAETPGRWHPAARPQLDRIANKLGRALERAGRGEEALAWYALAEAPPARERTARLLAGRGDQDGALALCAAIESSPRDETERVFAPRFAHRLRRRRGEAVPPWPRRARPERALRLARAEAGVEQRALAALARRGEPGFFAENWLWLSLFGLAFWDQVFAPVPGAFEHPFQSGPLDLHEPGFRAARAELIEARLEALRALERPAAALLEVYDRKLGTANALVSWHPAGRDALALAARRLSGAQLAWVCDRLSRDIGRYRRGFPDLFVVRRDGFALYEVKAPGDQLRPEQRGWIDYLNEGGLPTAILRVVWR